MLGDQTSGAGVIAGHFDGPSAYRVTEQPAAWASRWGVIATLQFAEVLTVMATLYFWLFFEGRHVGGNFGMTEQLLFAVIVAALVHSCLRYLCAYDFADLLNIQRSIARVTIAWLLTTGCGVLATVWMNTVSPNHVIIAGWLSGFVGLVAIRAVVAYVARTLIRTGRLAHNVIIMGSEAEAKRCAETLTEREDGTHIVAYVPLSAGWQSDRDGLVDAAAIGDLQQLIQRRRVKDIVVSRAACAPGELAKLIDAMLWLPVHVYVWRADDSADVEAIVAGGSRPTESSLVPVGAPPIDGWHWVLKDVSDRLAAALIIILVSPVLAGIALTIRLTSPGPILFKQLREGYAGSTFQILKFRTMRVEVDRKPDLMLTVMNDPRIFRFGSFLRKTSLDELPQLLNVLLGDMWLVGPRPHSRLATAAGQRYSTAIHGYIARMRVKPGMTGWAQINGWRGPTDTLEQIQQRFLYDQEYIRRQSFWFDLQILLQTVKKGFVGTNVY
jgi:exopolysaccharide biosynthesis polyprenyl glycosylphosphotransferase